MNETNLSVHHSCILWWMCGLASFYWLIGLIVPKRDIAITVLESHWRWYTFRANSKSNNKLLRNLSVFRISLLTSSSEWSTAYIWSLSGFVNFTISNIFVSENRIFIASSFQTFTRIQLVNWILFIFMIINEQGLIL